MSHASHLACALVLTGLACGPTLAAEFYESRRPIGHMLPDCTKPGPQRLLRCIPRVRIPVIPNVAAANDIFGYDSRPRRPYRQLFTWDR